VVDATGRCTFRMPKENEKRWFYLKTKPELAKPGVDVLITIFCDF
jgi:hypothetical protein